MDAARKHYPISVEMYHIMAEKGAFAPDDRIELIGGEIVEMSPIGIRHARAVDFLNAFLTSIFGSSYIVRVQNPIVATDDSEPQLDIAVLRRRDDFYLDAHPTGKDVLLVIEVADSTVAFDRSKKIPKYAAAGIPETWLIDLESEHIEVHTNPKEYAFGLVKIYLRGEDVVSETFAELRLPVADVIG